MSGIEEFAFHVFWPLVMMALVIFALVFLGALSWLAIKGFRS